MNVVPLLVGCSLLLVLCSVALFVWSVRRGEPDHADRLSLLPLEDDELPPKRRVAAKNKVTSQNDNDR